MDGKPGHNPARRLITMASRLYPGLPTTYLTHPAPLSTHSEFHPRRTFSASRACPRLICGLLPKLGGCFQNGNANNDEILGEKHMPALPLPPPTLGLIEPCSPRHPTKRKETTTFSQSRGTPSLLLSSTTRCIAQPPGCSPESQREKPSENSHALRQVMNQE